MASTAGQKYILLVEEYRRRRNAEGKTDEVKAILKKAQELLASGEVDEKSEEAARYI